MDMYRVPGRVGPGIVGLSAAFADPQSNIGKLMNT